MCIRDRPEPPAVTEIVDGSCIIRVKPLSEECREYSKKYVSTFGYQGNNLLCSNWNAEDMQLSLIHILCFRLFEIFRANRASI